MCCLAGGSQYKQVLSEKQEACLSPSACLSIRRPGMRACAHFLSDSRRAEGRGKERPQWPLHSIRGTLILSQSWLLQSPQVAGLNLFVMTRSCFQINGAPLPTSTQWPRFTHWGRCCSPPAWPLCCVTSLSFFRPVSTPNLSPALPCF